MRLRCRTQQRRAAFKIEVIAAMAVDLKPGWLSWTGRWLIKGPIVVYRLTLRPWLGWPCRHLPTCSDYALEAVDRNGAWRGLWLTISRLARCQPWGTAGLDPVPDIRAQRFLLRPWRYGRWSGRHIVQSWARADQPASSRPDRP